MGGFENFADENLQRNRAKAEKVAGNPHSAKKKTTGFPVPPLEDEPTYPEKLVAVNLNTLMRDLK